MKVLETIADDTLVILQIHKRVWPASQRDALFWSHVRRVANDVDPDGQDIWIACNHSTDHREAPVIYKNNLLYNSFLMLSSSSLFISQMTGRWFVWVLQFPLYVKHR